MFDWKKEVLKYKLILEKEFPSNCPVCHGKMEPGYVAGRLIKWVKKGSRNRMSADPLLMPDGGFHTIFRQSSIMPGYDCPHCRLIIAKHIPRHRTVNVVPENKSKNLEYCPYCSGRTRTGVIYSHSAMVWYGGMGRVFVKGIVKYIQPIIWFRIHGLPTRICDECGVSMIRYKPQGKWRYILKVLGFLSILIAVLLSILYFIMLYAE